MFAFRLSLHPSPHFLQYKFTTTFNPKISYYKILQISETATEQQIKKSFLTKVKQFHPDLNSNYQQKFKLINQAYQILSNTTLRKQYQKMYKIHLQNQSTSNIHRKQQQQLYDPIMNVVNTLIRNFNVKKKQKYGTHIEKQYQTYQSRKLQQQQNILKKKKNSQKIFKYFIITSFITSALITIEMIIK